ncbi:MAG: RHS repeat-associated core domain-containing protein [Candidatus Schekmanbacteria bacterium]|nr:RHS repeat-associated core domain-containing protein [Candidatus Schekmanbacteria bacterium]
MKLKATFFCLILFITVNSAWGSEKITASDSSYTYDIMELRNSMTDPSGTTTYEYDALDRLTKITNPAGQIITFTYDAIGKRTGLTHSTGLTASYTYDMGNRLTNLTWQMNGTPIATYTYTYDRVGNRLTMTDEYGTHTYSYDGVYQLTGATHLNQPSENYSYDPVGNRLGGTYDTANRLLEDADNVYGYNRNGNTLLKFDKATQEKMRFYWSPENQLIKIEKYHPGETSPYFISTYIYDGFGRRVAKNVNGTITKYLYDNEDILLETDNNDNVTARYTHGPGIDEPLIMQKGGQLYYYITDGLGSVIKLVNSVGNVVNNYAYDSFGRIVSKTEGVANSYTYTAREFDAESGLYCYRSRYFDSKIGRFLAEDKLNVAQLILDKQSVKKGSIEAAFIDYLLRLYLTHPSLFVNGYLYARNNSINHTDPWGLWYIDINLQWGKAGGGTTGGVMISDKGIYPYLGGGATMPGLGGGITWSSSDPTPGWNVELSIGTPAWLGVIGGYGDKHPYDTYWAVGIVSPGISLTRYYVWEFMKFGKKDCK